MDFKQYLEFQFHCGAIKSEELLIENETLTQFQFHCGAIKRFVLDIVKAFILIFQFHCGAIKSTCFFSEFKIPYLFQFHCGAIKRQKLILKQTKLNNFNSIVVRLKANKPFQLYLLQLHFNSIVVRLKACLEVIAFDCKIIYVLRIILL